MTSVPAGTDRPGYYGHLARLRGERPLKDDLERRLAWALSDRDEALGALQEIEYKARGSQTGTLLDVFNLAHRALAAVSSSPATTDEGEARDA